MLEDSYVLIYIDGRRSKLVKVRRDGRLSTDKGVLQFKDVIGRRYGEKVKLSTGITAYILQPTHLDYLLRGFKRVTQVIYPKDLGFIVLISNIGPGSRVIEGGVGTGFLTATLAKYVGNDGHVYAYEVRRDYIEVAERNLRLLGLEGRVTIKNKDIRVEVDEVDVDAAVLDIPDPWNALKTLSKALKPSAPLIAFLPTINQVERLITAALDMGTFIDVHIYELLLREYKVERGAIRPQSLMIGHTGYIVFMRLL